jgi:thioredoxin-dependent peroxiredoxin
MQTLRCLAAIVLLAAVAVTSGSGDSWAQTAAQLKPGSPAPLFSLAGSDDKTYNLSDFKGKQAVVLAWFVKAYSGG